MMQDMLTNQREFKISTPLNPDRTIYFDEDFQDHEFDGYVATHDKLILKADGVTVARLKFYKDRLEGDDTRGGKTVLTPTSDNKDRFIQNFKSAHPVDPLYKEKKEIELQGKIAIVTPFKFEGYTCIDPKSKRLYDVYDELFSKGYKFVFNIDCPTTKNFIPLLENLSNEFLKGARVGSVQLCSTRSSEDGAAVSIETGDWRGFSIDHLTWLKIKRKMSDKKLNFHRALVVNFKEKNLVRISTDMSRDRFSTPQDKARKNFTGV